MLILCLGLAPPQQENIIESEEMARLDVEMQPLKQQYTTESKRVDFMLRATRKYNRIQ